MKPPFTSIATANGYNEALIHTMANQCNRNDPFRARFKPNSCSSAGNKLNYRTGARAAIRDSDNILYED